MPSEASHIALANHNQALIDHLWPRLGSFPDWIATVAFYKALHVIEAVFSRDAEVVGCESHEMRNRTLKRSRKYAHIWKSYQELFAASIKARYLDGLGPGISFVDVYTPEFIRSRLLGHHLHQVEQSAIKFLLRPADLRRFAVPPSGPSGSPTEGQVPAA